jgi:PAS domain S-box-containing protein
MPLTASHQPRIFRQKPGRAPDGLSVTNLARITLLAVVYFLAGQLALLLAAPPLYATIIWPPAGIAAAILIGFGPSLSPGIFLGALLLNATLGPAYSIETGWSAERLAVAAVIAAGVTAQALLARALVARFMGTPLELGGTRDALRLLALAGPAASVVAPTIGVAALALHGSLAASGIAMNWLTWWAGDIFGVLVFLPIALAIREAPNRVKWRSVPIPTVPCAAILVLLLPLGLTAYAWKTSVEYTQKRSQALFSLLAEESEKILLHRMKSYVQGMRSGLVHMQANQQVKTRIWRRYIESMGVLENFPKAAEFGYIEKVEPGALEAFLQQARRERPDFKLHPKTGDGPYFIVRHPPLGDNPEIAGLNIAAEDSRLQAAERSRDTGEPALTGRIVLAQDQSQSPGFLVLMPLYKPGMATSTVEERRTALLGWICWPFTARAFLSDLTSGKDHSYRLRVYDGDNATRANLIYDSAPDGQEYNSAFRIRRPLRILQQHWTLDWTSAPAFEATVHSVESPLILGSGLLLTALFALQLFFFSRRAETVNALVKEQTRELAEREALYRLLAENSSDIISRVSFDGKRSYVSPACWSVLGYKPEELAGRHFFEWFDEHHRPGLEELYRQFERGERDHAILVLSKKKKDGGWIKAEETIKLVRDPLTRQPLETVVTTRDVTLSEQKSEELRIAKEEADCAKAKAETANEAKTTFLAAMSHEIRTPLNSIIGFTDILLSTRRDLEDTVRRQLHLIQMAGATLLSIVNDILDFSRIEAGEIKLDPRPFSLDELITKATSIVRPMIEEKHLEFIVERHMDAHAWYYGDDHRLTQILLNLLNNACKFTGDGSIRLVVESLREGDDRQRIWFSVIDTGPGIPAEKMSRLFKRFSQLENNTHRRFGGSGLGLAISKQLVELMGGTISAYSTEGRGCVFSFEVLLPLSEPPMAVTIDDEEAAYPKGLRILLAEDLEINREIAIATLALHDHKIDIAENGAEAVRAVKEREYDLILMDVQMPVMDGLKATEQIRSMPEPAGLIPIIAMTANVLPHQVDRIKQAGANDHIGKPFDKADLFRKIARWTKKGAARRVAAAEAATEAAATEATLVAANDSESAGPVFKEDVFQDVLETLGREKTDLYIKTLHDLVESIEIDRMDPDANREDIRRNAHKLVSTAGMLGFKQLSDAAIALETACDSGADIGARLHDLLEAGAAAKHYMDDLRSAA